MTRTSVRSRQLRRARSAVVAVLAVAVLVAGCSSSDDDNDAAEGSAPAGDPSGSTDGGPTSEPDPPEQFSGAVEDFYRVPDPLPEGEPGDLIRVQEMSGADGQESVRVMYHSRDAKDRDRAVTGVITYPTGEAPDGGWPVISWAHGTTGLASECAPSRSIDEAPGFGIEGVRVATDYVGLGPVGELHPYLSRESEGNSVIDAVRAAGQLRDAHAGPRWLAVGHSQGGHGALAAHELAQAYAPELELLGTVAWAPASDLDRTFGTFDEIVARIVGAMHLYGAAAEHPEIDIEDYIGPELAAQDAVIEEGCLDEIAAAFIAIPAETFYENDPFETEPARAILLGNDVGQVAADAPLFLVSGTADDRVVIDRVRVLYDRLCELGQVTELLVVEGANHDDVIPRTSDQVTTWLNDRLAGSPPTDSCLDQ